MPKHPIQEAFGLGETPTNSGAAADIADAVETYSVFHAQSVSDITTKNLERTKAILLKTSTGYAVYFYEPDNTDAEDGSRVIWDSEDRPFVRQGGIGTGKRFGVRAATTENVTIATALNDGDTIDGITLATNDIVLVKDQTDKEENGVYVVGVSPARHSDFDTYDDHVGALIAVEEGTTNKNTLWFALANDGGTLDTTDIEFSQIEVTSDVPGPEGDPGADGTDPGILLTWDDGNTQADPGPGKIAADNDDLSLATKLYVSKTNRAGDDIETRLLGLESSTNTTTKAAITLTKSGGSAQAFFDLSAVDDDTDFVVLHVQNHSGATGFTLADAISLQAERDGNAGGGLANVVEDTTPQLGGMLDVNGQALGDGTLELLKFEETASAVNELTIKNATTGSAPELQATGDDENIDLVLMPKGTGVLKSGSNAVLTAGLHLIGVWNAGDLVRPTTDAADALAQLESTTNKVNDEYLSFPNGSTKYAGLSFRAPKSSDESADLVIEIEWTEAGSATAHVCRWQAEAQAQGDGDTIDSAWGSAVAVDDTGTAGTRRFCEITVTPGGTWAAGDKIHVRVARLGGHANDTLDVAAYLLGVTVHGTINARNDA